MNTYDKERLLLALTHSLQSEITASNDNLTTITVNRRQLADTIRLVVELHGGTSNE